MHLPFRRICVESFGICTCSQENHTSSWVLLLLLLLFFILQRKGTASHRMVPDSPHLPMYLLLCNFIRFASGCGAELSLRGGNELAFRYNPLSDLRTLVHQLRQHWGLLVLFVSPMVLIFTTVGELKTYDYRISCLSRSKELSPNDWR